MFGLAGFEWVIIVVVAILLFGSQAPKLVGKFFQNAKSVKEEISKGVETISKKDSEKKV